MRIFQLPFTGTTNNNQAQNQQAPLSSAVMQNKPSSLQRSPASDHVSFKSSMLIGEVVKCGDKYVQRVLHADGSLGGWHDVAPPHPSLGVREYAQGKFVDKFGRKCDAQGNTLAPPPEPVRSEPRRHHHHHSSHNYR